MGNRSGLIALADGVRAYFQALRVPAIVTPVGWKYRSFQVNQGPGGGSRVCFIPGKFDPTAGTPPKMIEAGTFEQPRFANAGAPLSRTANPRRLVQWKKIVTLCIWGVDVSDLSSDELQMAATEDLIELTYQGMHNAIDPVTGLNAGLADVILTEAKWVLPPIEVAFGREFVAYFTHAGPLLDQAVPVVYPKAAIARDPST